ncbi:unnamed protein product [Agarophyton chilense]|eukprot:gb/GEZJ01001110.1/.p1 GENE.gb/GEZJ01001110.1/~~gb/GEZJ01001110.1/.p1  ORF type:complete len:1451 (+),score=188.32 gb/GEZJ01001110.1/:7044-11396(+)
MEIADSFWFVICAYVAAFAPWTIISEKDFISAKWRTVKNTRNAAYHNLFWSCVPFLYVVVYCIIQALAGDYKETCAALIAALFALRHMSRTLWGLWQLNYFRSWAKNSILALEAIGIDYQLPGPRHQKQKNGTATKPHTAAYIADHILVNEKIVDNQIMHGHLHSFLAYGNINVLTHADDKIHLLDPVLGMAHWLRIAFAFISDRLLNIFGHRREHSLRQIPLRPVEVWVHWAAVFAAQGLKDWLADFDVVSDPDAQPSDPGLSAIDRLRQRGRYFSTQVLASATLQLWPDYDLGLCSGPFLWDEWPVDSQMSDGHVVKQELFEQAIRSGKALPFCVPHLKDLEGLEEYDDLTPYGYDAYRDVLTEFIAELPVKSIHTREIREFDIDKLEWLTILMYMGTLSRECRAKQKARRKADEASSTSSSDDDHDFSSSTSSSGSSSSTDFMSKLCDVDSDQAVATLRAQLNIPGHQVSRHRLSRKQAYTTDSGVIRIAFPIGMNLVSIPAAENRLVTRVGELIDVWMALVSGSQVSFLLDELNKEWETFCLGPNIAELCEIGQAAGENVTMREVNSELEKRRLMCRVADKTHKYKFMDQFVTFIGYRMESVRSSLARWVSKHEGKYGDDFFRRANKTDLNHLRFQVPLSRVISSALESEQYLKALDRHCVQCRLIWELQNFLESMLLSETQQMPEQIFAEDHIYVAMVMLFIISFPSLRVYPTHESSDTDDETAVEGADTTFERSATCGNVNNNQVYAGMRISPICGPQKISVLLKLGTAGECTVQVLSDCEEFRWRWWRDAFIGRLEGFRDWQRDLGISSVDVDHIRNDQLLGILRLQTATKASFLTWNEWPPFRAVICRFELESKGLLQQPVIEEYKTPLIHFDTTGVMSHFAKLPVKNVQAVSYKDADDAVLMHTCLLVQDAVRDHYKNSKSTSSTVNEGNPVDLMMHLASTIEPSRASTLYEMAALQYKRTDALMKCMELLFDFGESSENYYRGLDILRSFVATMLSVTAISAEVSDEDKVKFRMHVLPACEKVLLLEGDKGYVYRPLMDILNAYLICDPKNHQERAALAMQQLLFLTQTHRTPLRAFCDIAQAILFVEASNSGNENICRLLKIEAERFSFENGKTRLKLLELAVDRGTSHLQSRGLSKSILARQAGYEDLRKSCITSKQQKMAMEELGYVRAIYNLAVLLHIGTKGVQQNAGRAAQLYQRLIDEWNDPYAMLNLACLLERGGEGLVPDMERAIELYKRAIVEEKNVEAMFSLAQIRHYGAQGVSPNLREAIDLYEQAIEKGHHVEAKYNLATLLQTGGDGVKPDLRTAIALYEQVIGSRKHLHAMYNLANLLQSKGSGLEPRIGRAINLYESAAEEEDVNAMYALADLLLNERDEMLMNEAKAKFYIRKAVESKSSVGIGAQHMQNVWSTLRVGSLLVKKDTELCVAIKAHAQRSGIELN